MHIAFITIMLLVANESETTMKPGDIIVTRNRGALFPDLIAFYQWLDGGHLYWGDHVMLCVAPGKVISAEPLKVRIMDESDISRYGEIRIYRIESIKNDNNEIKFDEPTINKIITNAMQYNGRLYGVFKFILHAAFIPKLGGLITIDDFPICSWLVAKSITDATGWDSWSTCDGKNVSYKHVRPAEIDYWCRTTNDARVIRVK